MYGQLDARGGEQHSRVLVLATILAPDLAVRRLGLAVEDLVERIVRIRTAASEPLVMETAYFPVALADDLDLKHLERASIYD